MTTLSQPSDNISPFLLCTGEGFLMKIWQRTRRGTPCVRTECVFYSKMANFFCLCRFFFALHNTKKTSPFSLLPLRVKRRPEEWNLLCILWCSFFSHKFEWEKVHSFVDEIIADYKDEYRKRDNRIDCKLDWDDSFDQLTSLFFPFSFEVDTNDIHERVSVSPLFEVNWTFLQL